MNVGKTDVRRAGIGDFDSILEIQRTDGFEHAYYLTKVRYERLLSRGETFYLAREDENLTGFISVDYEERAKLHFFSVSKDYQNRGVGTKLLNYIKEEAKVKGYKALHVYTEIDSMVENFLMNNGFVKVGFYKNRYDKGRDANILQLDL